MRRVRLAVGCLALCGGVSTALQSQDSGRRTIAGVVIDSTRTALAYANITIGQTRTIANDSGRFALRNVGHGPLKLLVRRIGFEVTEVSLPPGSDTSVAIVMAQNAVRLSAVTVVAPSSAKLELRGFYERMRDVDRGINRGYFITPEDLEQRRPNFITQMLESYPSVRVFSGAGLHYAVIEGVGRCKMTVYLDGTRVIGKLNPRGEEPINLVVKPNDIAGVEIYPRAVQAPPQYQSLNSSCGVVLIWTK